MLPLVIRIKDVESHPPLEKQYVFTTSPVRIGRNQLNDIPIPRPFVSLFHALVRFDKGSIAIVDLGSTNGVVVAGKRIEKNVPAQLKPGMPVTIGSVEFEFSRDAKAQKDTSSRQTQFRALADILNEGGIKPEALSFKPTPIQERKQEQRTAMLPSLDALLEQEAAQEEVTGQQPRTIIAPALQDVPGDEATNLELHTVSGEEEAPQPRKPIPPPAMVPSTGRKRTMSSVQVLPQAPGGAAALQNTIQQLVPLYNSYRTAWKMLHQGLAKGVDTLPEQDRGQLIAQLQRRMPEMTQEPMFQEIAKNVGRPVNPEPVTGGPAPAASGPGNRLDVVSRELLNRFVRSYLADNRGLQTEADMQRFLEHMAELLETFARAFIELRQGHDQFGQQMAVPVTHDQNPLTRMRSTRELLRYLLDFKVPESANRVQELMGGFVDVMIHQIALLNGMREGVKGLLQRLDPELLGKGIGGVWPFNLVKKWEKYTEQHRAFLDEERELTAVLFGPEFAKAYLAIVGDAAKQGSGDASDTLDGGAEEDAES